MFYISLDRQEYFFWSSNLRFPCVSWILSMVQVTEYVKYINQFKKKLIWAIFPQPESLLSTVCRDDKESVPCLCLIVD